MAQSRLELREGGRPIAQVAADLKCSPRNLEQVAYWRPGPAGEKLIDPVEEERIRHEHCCPGCGALAVGPSGYCRDCAASAILTGVPRPPHIRQAISEAHKGVSDPSIAAALRQRWESDPEFRARLTQQLAEGKAAEDEHIARQLRSLGKAGTSTAGELLLYSHHGIWSAGARERQGKSMRQGLRQETGVGYAEVTTTTGKLVRRVAFDAKKLGDAHRERTGRNDGYRRLSAELSAANKTDFGRPRALTDAEVADASALRQADPKNWSYRKLATKVNEDRAATLGEHAERVSHMAVATAIKRAQARL